MEILIISLLMFKHFLGDFVFQMDYMIQQKGSYGMRGGLDHASIHAFLTAVIIWIFVPVLSTVFLVGLIDGIVHYHIDWLKSNMSKEYTIKDRAFWIWFGMDQLAHYLTYAGITIWVLAYYGYLTE